MTYMQFNELNQNYKNSIMLWLLTLTVMVFLIIIIGGLTRLTDSGLSMVDWQPILGTIPPLNNTQWLEVFNNIYPRLITGISWLVDGKKWFIRRSICESI